MALSPSSPLGWTAFNLHGGDAVGSGFVLHVVTDALESRLPLAAALRAVAGAGADAIQVREKGRPAQALLEGTRAALVSGCPCVLVNDRVDVALAAGAAGVHLPARGLPVALARSLLPRAQGWWLGVSVHAVEDAVAAARDGADYVTFGHVFQTESKPGLPPQGVAALRRVVAAAPLPVLAIGGIAPANVGAILETGCAGVAVIRAVLGAPDPGAAVADLRRALAASAATPRHRFPTSGGAARA